MHWTHAAANKYVVLAGEIDRGTDLSGFLLRHLCALYLISSYLYYQLDYSLMQDNSFDRLCRHLWGNFQKIHEGHVRNPELFDESALQAGTGFHLVNQIPTDIHNIVAAMKMDAETRRKLI